ncbi:MAG: hypothetical protein KJO31_00215 [Gammaproteobacteria bacterium]|nr:hypothetical protein [Gammaproteobacteria bacterium]
MSFEQVLASTFRMTDDVWARHANPWSVWTRFSCLPLLALSIWSRAWIGGWAWVPVVLTLLWAWGNPRAFARPESTDNWASRAVLGERVWLNRGSVPIPAHHQVVVRVLNSLTAVGMAIGIFGLVYLRPYETAAGVILAMLLKGWFLDRMVWLYDEMRTANSTYRAWLYD